MGWVRVWKQHHYEKYDAVCVRPKLNKHIVFVYTEKWKKIAIGVFHFIVGITLLITKHGLKQLD
jgi:hypothetical protein